MIAIFIIGKLSKRNTIGTSAIEYTVMFEFRGFGVVVVVRRMDILAEQLVKKRQTMSTSCR